MSNALQHTAGSSCLDITQVNCPICDHPMLHSTQVTVPCHDGQGYHRSSCVNCLLTEMDDCCFEITEDTLVTIDNYIECKLINKTKHAQEVTDHAIFNFLEYALGSVIHVDDAPNNAALVPSSPSQAVTLQHQVQTAVAHQNAAAHDSDFEDSEVKIICNDLSEEESTSCTDLTNRTTPEDLPDYVDDHMPPPIDISKIFNEVLSEHEMSETVDDVQHDCPEWLQWKH
ncbi:hypothetical protein KCU93_g2920, partial [Aureobasidium melanogenum]